MKRRIDVTQVFRTLKNILVVQEEHRQLIFVILNKKMLKFVGKIT